MVANIVWGFGRPRVGKLMQEYRWRSTAAQAAHTIHYVNNALYVLSVWWVDLLRAEMAWSGFRLVDVPAFPLLWLEVVLVAGIVMSAHSALHVLTCLSA